MIYHNLFTCEFSWRIIVPSLVFLGLSVFAVAYVCVFSLSFFGEHRVLYLRPQTYEYQTRPLSQQLLFSFDACTTFIIATANPTALNGLNKMLADNTDTLRCWWVFFPCWYLDAMQILSMNMRTQAHT